jgi:hypothetical protein
VVAFFDHEAVPNNEEVALPLKKLELIDALANEADIVTNEALA